MCDQIKLKLPSIYNSLSRLGAVFIIVICLQISHAIAAPNRNLAEVRQSYTERPNIEAVAAQTRDKLGSSWALLKQSHFQFIAQILEFYPDRELYFLARDSELLYDAAKLIADPSEIQRLHLLNVSRANMRDPNLKYYLQQEGIDELSLLGGKKIVFIDTGFAGTIPAVIGEQFSEKAREQIKTHLIVSNNTSHPSSRTFLAPLNAAINSVSPTVMHSTIISYEHIPRMTSRSDRYEKRHGIWVPTGIVGNHDDGSVNPKIALAYMEDLKWTAQQEATRLRVRTEREYWRKLVSLIKSTEISTKEKARRIKMILHLSPKSEFAIRDLIDAQKNMDEIRRPLEEKDVGLQVQDVSKNGPSKLDLAKKFPDWKPILENPETEIPKAFADGNLQILSAIVDVLADPEIDKIVAKELRNPPYTIQKIALIEALMDSKIKIEKDSVGSYRYKYLGEYVFKNLPADQFFGLFQKAVENSYSFDLLAPFFTLPLTDLHIRLILNYLNKGKYYLETLMNLWKDIDLTEKHFELIEFGLKNWVDPDIENGWRSYIELLRTVLPTKTGIKYTELLFRALRVTAAQGVDYQTLPQYLEKVASLDLPREDRINIFRIIIENASVNSLSADFNSGKTRDAINKNILLLMEENSFAQNRTQILSHWFKSTFVGAQGPGKILRIALNIKDPSQRKSFLDSKLGRVVMTRVSDLPQSNPLAKITPTDLLVPAKSLKCSDLVSP